MNSAEQLWALIVPSWSPVTSVAYLLFVRHLGGILAVANIRGGGEYGLTWHKGKDPNQEQPARSELLDHDKDFVV